MAGPEGPGPGLQPPLGSVPWDHTWVRQRVPVVLTASFHLEEATSTRVSCLSKVTPRRRIQRSRGCALGQTPAERLHPATRPVFGSLAGARRVWVSALALPSLSLSSTTCTGNRKRKTLLGGCFLRIQWYEETLQVRRAPGTRLVLRDGRRGGPRWPEPGLYRRNRDKRRKGSGFA